MSYRELPPEVWPVIHFSTMDMAMRNAELADKCGCAGVFLIHHQGLDRLIPAAALAVKKMYPRLRIGINLLSTPAAEAVGVSMSNGFDATWADAPGVRSDGLTREALEISEQIKGKQHLFFASVAFKHQPEDPWPGRAASKAVGLGFIPTTSGPETGVAPSEDKLIEMRSTIGKGSPLAVASGVTPENVGTLGAHLTHILVASGVSKSWHEFDETRLRSLMTAVTDMG